ncbi:MAG: hypothetical protein AAB530_00345 [Patescibacteria group bacterium]
MKFSITKITHRIISRYIYSLLIIFIIATLSYLFLFLYKNFYQVIIQAKEIPIFKEKVAKEIIDVNEFNKVIDKLNQKITPSKITSKLNDPF